MSPEHRPIRRKVGDRQGQRKRAARQGVKKLLEGEEGQKERKKRKQQPGNSAQRAGQP